MILKENMALKKIIILTGIAFGIYLVFRFLLPLVLPFVVAGIVSVIYYPLLRKIYTNNRFLIGKRKKWFLVFSVVFLYLLLFLIIGSLCCYLLGQGQSIILNFPFYQAKVMCLIKDCCCQMDIFFHVEKGVCFTYVEGMMDNMWSESATGMLPRFTSVSVKAAGKIFHVIFCMIVTVMATFFMVQDYDAIRAKMLASEVGRKMCDVVAKCKETLKAYLKAQGVIMLLDGTLCTIAFLLAKQPYAVMLGVLTAIVDALPVLGAGLILIPYALFLLLLGEAGKAAIIFLAYLGCIFVRQLTEPRMIGRKAGIKPLYTIVGMYVGFKLFGVAGFLLGPVGMLIGKEIYTFFLAKIKE